MREHTETLNTQFAETLRKLRVEKGLSQAQLSEQLFVNSPEFWTWISIQCSPSR